MIDVARGIILVQETDRPTPQQIKECLPYYDGGVSEQTVEDWYCLLHQAQGNLFVYNDGLKYMIDNHDFLGDSLFCEWAYVINLDEGLLEVYKGFQKARTENRYAQFIDPTSSYANCRLIATYPLTALPDETRFLAQIAF
jgi:hypothetical protein